MNSSPFTMLKHYEQSQPDYVSFKNLFSPEQCQHIIELSRKYEPVDAAISQGKQEKKIDKGIRDSQVHWITYDQDTHWIFERLCDVVSDINMEHFRYELDGSSFDIQLTKYGPGQYYGWHRDMGGGAISRRKLSASIQLSDPETYTGGELVFFRHQSATADNSQGSLTVFPSWATHQANEVTDGERWALVAWFEGPPIS